MHSQTSRWYVKVDWGPREGGGEGISNSARGASLHSPEGNDHAALQVILCAVLEVKDEVTPQSAVAIRVEIRVHRGPVDLSDLEHVLVDHRQHRQPRRECEHVEPEPTGGPDPRARVEVEEAGALRPRVRPRFRCCRPDGRRLLETPPYRRPERHEAVNFVRLFFSSSPSILRGHGRVGN